MGDPGACAAPVRRAGLRATTVDQIAAAAEISPSTFFRYFPTKEDLVIQDQYDDLLAAALLAAPAELSPLGALRAAVREAFSAMPPAEEARLRERSKLVFAVPALRARSFENVLGTLDRLREAIAARTGRSADESSPGAGRRGGRSHARHVELWSPIARAGPG